MNLEIRVGFCRTGGSRGSWGERRSLRTQERVSALLPVCVAGVLREEKGPGLYPDGEGLPGFK